MQNGKKHEKNAISPQLRQHSSYLFHATHYDKIGMHAGRQAQNSSVESWVGSRQKNVKRKKKLKIQDICSNIVVNKVCRQISKDSLNFEGEEEKNTQPDLECWRRQGWRQRQQCLTHCKNSFSAITAKVIYHKYSKHRFYLLTHSMDCDCSKILNHGLFLSLEASDVTYFKTG